MWTTSVAAFTAAYQPVPVISHARRASAPQMLATNLPIADELMMWARVFRLTDYAALAGGAAVIAGGLAAAEAFPDPDRPAPKCKGQLSRAGSPLTVIM